MVYYALVSRFCIQIFSMYLISLQIDTVCVHPWVYTLRWGNSSLRVNIQSLCTKVRGRLTIIHTLTWRVVKRGCITRKHCLSNLWCGDISVSPEYNTEEEKCFTHVAYSNRNFQQGCTSAKPSPSYITEGRIDEQVTVIQKATVPHWILQAYIPNSHFWWMEMWAYVVL